jgi:hypothetical protein
MRTIADTRGQCPERQQSAISGHWRSVASRLQRNHKRTLKLPTYPDAWCLFLWAWLKTRAGRSQETEWWCVPNFSNFSGLNTFRVASTRYCCTPPAYLAYASTSLLSAKPQGSILGSRRTITQAGLPPARTPGLARPCRPRCSLFLPNWTLAALLAGHFFRSSGSVWRFPSSSPRALDIRGGQRSVEGDVHC